MAVRRLLVAGGLTAALSLSVVGQTIVADPRVGKVFEELKWSVKTDEDGDYDVVMQCANNRTQLLVVRSRTFTTGKLEQREIWSAAGKVEGEIPVELARRLLAANLELKYGFWTVLPQSNGGQMVLYTARVPVDIDPETFADYCQSVAEITDGLEEELTGKDTF